MGKLFRQSRFACLSWLCTVAGVLFWWFLLYTGTLHRLGYSVDRAAKFAALSPCLIGVVLATAGLRWDRRKALALLALLASLAGMAVLFLD